MLFDRSDKGADILEREVDARKAHPRDTIDGLEGFHHAFTDGLGRDLWDQLLGEITFDAGDDGLLLFACDGPFLAGTFEAAENFITVPWFFASVRFDDGGQGQFRVLVGRESPFALLARAPPPDGVSVADESAVDDPGIVVTTSRAAHRSWG